MSSISAGAEESVPSSVPGPDDAGASDVPTDLLTEAAARAGLDPQVGETLARWLAAQLVGDRFARLEQAGAGVEGGIPLARVFVDLEVATTPQPEPSESAAPVRGFVARTLELQPRRLVERASGARVTGRRATREMATTAELAAGGDPPEPTTGFVLIGGPGQGKSTLGQLLCQLHRAALLAPRAAQLDEEARKAVEAFAGPRAQQELGRPIAPCLPVRLVLAEVAAWLAARGAPAEAATEEAEAPLALLEYLTESIQERTGHVLAPAQLQRLLVACPWLLVLDGLDEVPASSDRDRMLVAARSLVAWLLRGGARGLVVATTRPQGYAGELDELGLALQTRHLVPLSKDRALVYAEKLAEARFAEPPERRKRVLERLRLAAEEEATARLMRSPLQVTIMATLVDRVGRAPRERWNLFRDYYRVIYEREMERTVEGPASAGVGVALNDTAELLRSHRAYIDRIHANVALLLQVESEHSGGTAALMTAGRLEQVIDAVLAEDEIEPQARRALTGRIVQAARDRLVFLVEPQPGRFGFEIRSLQEFMAAWALASKGEVLLEKRIAGLAKAASFRNVVLFLVSKCFTELSDLRDAFTERICPQLNDDPEDEVARATLAGSMLALDILEEGSALEQPKYARRLMEIATRLLELPPGPEHIRLAEIQATSTVDTLRGALLHRLTDGCMPARLAAWLSTIVAAELGVGWACQLAGVHWPADGEARRLILVAVVENIGAVGPWLHQRVCEAPEDFTPSLLESALDGIAVEHDKTSSTSWLAAIADIIDPSTRSLDIIVRFEGFKTSAYIDLSPLWNTNTAWQNLANTRLSEPSWAAWTAAAEFAIDPSAQSLAKVLCQLAEHGALEKLGRWFSSYVPWPLAACLETSSSPADLVRMSQLARSGALGDRSDWQAAEARWASRGIRWDDILSLADKEAPFGARIAAEGFPSSAPHGIVLKLPDTDRDRWTTALRNDFAAASTATIRRTIARILLYACEQLGRAGKRLSKPFSPDELGNLLGATQRRLSPYVLVAGADLSASTAAWHDAIESATHIEPDWQFGLYTLDTHKRTSDAIQWVATLYSAQPSRNALVRLLGLMAFHGYGSPRGLNPTLLQPEQFADADTRAAAVLLILAQGQLVQDDPEITARELVEHWSAEVFPIHRLSRFFQFLSLLLDRDTLDQLLLALYRHALPRSWSLAGALIALLRDRFRQRASGLDDPARWDHLRLPLPLPLVFPVSGFVFPMSGAEPAGPMYLRQVTVERVRSITSLQWELPRAERGPGWHVILGENGAGKSSFLRAVALSLLGPDASGALRQPWGEWVRRDATSARVEARLSYEVTTHGPHAHPPGLHPAAGQDGSDIRSDLSLDLILELAQAGTETKIVEQTEAARALVRRAAGAFSAAYGPFRRFSDGDPAYERMFVDQPRVARHISLFDSRITLTESLAWLRELRFKQLDNKPEGALLEPFKKFASDAGPPFFLPHGAHLADVSSDGVTFVDGNGFEIPVEDLSDGYRAVLSLTFDLIRHMAAVFGHERVFDPEDPSVVLPGGVVLIDEIDAHLHPSWQRQIGHWFKKHFPNVQFLVTTHSPLVCQAADTVFLLPAPGSDEEARRVEGVDLERLRYGNVLEAYGTDVFGRGVTRSEEGKRLLEKLVALNRKEQERGLSPEEMEEQERLRAIFPTSAVSTRGGAA
ncbi:AAA family ATPase [Sorangium sp. So ce854]|uniref:AAA family ATPase n=1 Tax=Sorangium sp. So ce854 TaxID=3133322 RepID=UPI003F62BB12